MIINTITKYININCKKGISIYIKGLESDNYLILYNEKGRNKIVNFHFNGYVFYPLEVGSRIGFQTSSSSIEIELYNDIDLTKYVVKDCCENMITDIFNEVVTVEENYRIYTEHTFIAHSVRCLLNGVQLEFDIDYQEVNGEYLQLTETGQSKLSESDNIFVHYQKI